MAYNGRDHPAQFRPPRHAPQFPQPSHAPQFPPPPPPHVAAHGHHLPHYPLLHSPWLPPHFAAHGHHIPYYPQPPYPYSDPLLFIPGVNMAPPPPRIAPAPPVKQYFAPYPHPYDHPFPAPPTYQDVNFYEANQSFSQLGANLGMNQNFNEVGANLGMNQNFNEVGANVGMNESISEVGANLGMNQSFSELGSNVGMNPSFREVDADVDMNQSSNELDANVGMNESSSELDANVGMNESSSELGANVGTNGRTTTPQKANTDKKIKTERPSCDICNIRCTSESDLTRHNEGKKHNKNIGKLIVANQKPKKTWTPKGGAAADSVQDDAGGERHAREANKGTGA